MKKSLRCYSKLMQLCDYLKNPCWVFCDGSEESVHYFSSVQKLIDHIFDDDIESYITDFHTYNINFIGIQQSLFDDDANIVLIYMI